ncbi:unnamed protein product [Lampetra fluviatilis]
MGDHRTTTTTSTTGTTTTTTSSSSSGGVDGDDGTPASRASRGGRPNRFSLKRRSEPLELQRRDSPRHRGGTVSDDLGLGHSRDSLGGGGGGGGGERSQEPSVGPRDGLILRGGGAGNGEGGGGGGEVEEEVEEEKEEEEQETAVGPPGTVPSASPEGTRRLALAPARSRDSLLGAAAGAGLRRSVRESPREPSVGPRENRDGRTAVTAGTAGQPGQPSRSGGRSWGAAFRQGEPQGA